MTEIKEKTKIEILDHRDMELLDQEKKSLSWSFSVGYLYAIVAVSVIIFNLYMIGRFDGDDSAVVVSQGREQQLDAPVVLNDFDGAVTEQQYSIFVRGFIRRYLFAQFPRTAEDVVPSLTFLIDHTDPNWPDMILYKDMLKKQKDVRMWISGGNVTRVYPRPLTSQERESGVSVLKVRPNGNGWTIEMDVLMNKQYQGQEIRKVPTLRYEIVRTAKTLKNPEGLMVTSSNIKEVEDWIGGCLKGRCDEPSSNVGDKNNEEN